MPSVADLVESHLLRALTDGDTYAAGVALADSGAVAFDQFGPMHVRVWVEDGERFLVDLHSGPGRLAWSCSEPGGSRGALCCHCVAAAVEIRRYAPARTSEPVMPEEAEGDRPRTDVEPAPDRPELALAPLIEAVAGVAPELPPASELPPAPNATLAPEAAPAPGSSGISGLHAIVFTPAPTEVREFFRDTLALPHVDAGDGWLIFALPPAELAVHPADTPSQAIYLICDDLQATVASLEGRGVEVRRPIRKEAWGFVTEMVLPGGTELAIYQPTHPRPPIGPGEPPA